MNGAPFMSGEAFRKLAENLKAYLQALIGLQREAIILGAKVLGWASAAGAVIGTLDAMSQSIAIGFYAAWKTYRTWWLLSPLIGACAAIGFIVLGLIIYSGTLEIERMLKARPREKVRRTLGSVVVVLLVFGLVPTVVELSLYMGYDSARRENDLRGFQLADLGAVSRAVGRQWKTLTDLSRHGANLLHSLDDVGRAIQSTREELAATLRTVETNAASRGKAASDVANLAQKQRQVELRLGEPQRLLKANMPITKEDLESVNRLGMGLGAVLGFGTSLAAAFFCNWVRRRVGRRSTGSHRVT